MGTTSSKHKKNRKDKSKVAPSSEVETTLGNEEAVVQEEETPTTVADDELLAQCELKVEESEQIQKFKELVSQGIMTIEDYEEARDEYLSTLGITITYDHQNAPPTLQQETETSEEQSGSLQAQLQARRKILKTRTLSTRYHTAVNIPDDNAEQDPAMLQPKDILNKKMNLKKVEKKEDWKNVF